MSEQPPPPGAWWSPDGRPPTTEPTTQVPSQAPTESTPEPTTQLPGPPPGSPPAAAGPPAHPDAHSEHTFDRPAEPVQPTPTQRAPTQPAPGQPPLPGAPTSWGAAPAVHPGAAYGLPYGAPPGPQWAPAPRPGVVPLRPLGLGELLDGAVQTMRQNPRVMLGFSAAVMAVVGVVSTVLQVLGLTRLTTLAGTVESESGADIATAVGGGFGGLVLPALLQALASIVLSGLLIVAVSEAVLGRRPPVAEVWTTARPRLLRLVGVSLLTLLISLLAVAVLVGAGLALLAVSRTAGVVGLLVGVPLALVVVVLVYVRLAFAAPALLLERLGVVESMRRSWRLVSGSWWRVFGILLLTAVIAAVAGGVLRAPFALIGGFVAAALTPDGAEASGAVTLPLVITAVTTNIAIVVAATVTAPFSAAVTALLYIDLRIRREGLDVALARAAGG